MTNFSSPIKIFFMVCTLTGLFLSCGTRSSGLYDALSSDSGGADIEETTSPEDIWVPSDTFTVDTLIAADGLVSDLYQKEDGAVLPDANEIVLPDLPAIILDYHYPDTLFDLINLAESTIHIIHYQCNSDYLVDKVIAALVARREAGVTVKAIFDEDPSDNAACVTSLTQNGIDAKVDLSDITMHAKIVVVDGRYVLLGSSNWSVVSMKYNHETNLLCEDKTLAAALISYQNSLWNGSDKLIKKSPVTSSGITLVTDAGYASQVRPLITQTQDKAFLVVYAINYSSQYPDADVSMLLKELGAAKKRGVDVRVLLENSDFDTALNDMNGKAKTYLESFGIPVKLDDLKNITHAKMLIVDNRVVIGTGNWTYAGLETNHEVGLIISDNGTWTDAIDYYNWLWNQY